VDGLLSETACQFSNWTWAEIEPLMGELAERPLEASNLEAWLADWSHLRSLVEEASARLEVAAARDTSDTAAEARFHAFREEIYNPALAADQRIVQHLLHSDLRAPRGFETALRRMRADAELFHEENLDLLTEEQRLVNAYNRIVGAQTACWDGEEVTLYELEAKLEDPNRATRENAWRLRVQRQLDDTQALNAAWGDLLALRHQMALNAGFRDYRAFRWQQLHRFEYTPGDCGRFRDAIESVAVPAARRIHERYQRCLGVASLRPWDLEVDPLSRPPLKPFQDAGELERKASAVFQRVDPRLGATFELMRRQGLLDLENRKDKAPHGWCATYPFARQAFIFMNAVGWQRDVMMLLHEAGHAFHVFEMAGLPYFHQLEVPAEFLEVASMAMELLASTYLTETERGFYAEADAARARVKHLEDAIIVSWPYIAAMDAFQDWAYTDPDVARNGQRCGEVWAEIWLRFMPGVDWSGLDDALHVTWQAIPHFFGWPLSGIEYGFAQLGAVQVWRNALEDQRAGVARLRRALSLGGTASVPKLYEAAGARFAFDVETLRESVALMESTIAALL